MCHDKYIYFIKTASGIQKLIGRDSQTRQHDDFVSIIKFLQNRLTIPFHLVSFTQFAM
jgi:hypothetical protein